MVTALPSATAARLANIPRLSMRTVPMPFAASPSASNLYVGFHAKRIIAVAVSRARAGYD
jgi:hypothetical protein